MNVSEIIRRACPTFGELATLASISPDYMRHLAKPVRPRAAGYEARHKLAKALRGQAERLLADAEELERST